VIDTPHPQPKAWSPGDPMVERTGAEAGGDGTREPRQPLPVDAAPSDATIRSVPTTSETEKAA